MVLISADGKDIYIHLHGMVAVVTSGALI